MKLAEGTVVRQRRSLVRRAFGCCLAAICLSFAFSTASAYARVTHVDGISDQNLARWGNAQLNVSSFSHSNFPNLFRSVWAGDGSASRIQYARFVVPWDVMGDAGGERLHYELFTAWLEDVKWLGLTPDVAVAQAEEPVVSDGVTLPRVPSSQTQYEQYVSALLSYAASIGEPISSLEAWNEPNNPGVGASGHPSAEAAAEFMNAATTLCAEYDCTPIAGDFLDAKYKWSDHGEGKEGSTGMGVNYEQEYEQYLSPKNPSNWGFHPYAAVKYELNETIEAFKSALPDAADSLWFTEVGVYECQNGRTTGTGIKAEEQAGEASYLNELINTYFEVSHVFYYELKAPSEEQEKTCPDGADTSLYDYKGEARPTASIVFGGGWGWTETLGWQMQSLLGDELAP